jgi:hypothetical protein
MSAATDGRRGATPLPRRGSTADGGAAIRGCDAFAAAAHLAIATQFFPVMATIAEPF